MKNEREREGGKMEKDDGFIWILVIGLVIFAIATLFIYAGP
jgi:tetrahydromethanopterin S-methyltransferase subunit G